MKDILVELKFRNNRIVKKMHESGITTVTELVRRINTSLGVEESKTTGTSLGKLINMKEPAKKANGEWSSEALRLANFFRCVPDDLFSHEQQSGSLQTNIANAEMSFTEIQQLTSPLSVTPEAYVQAIELKATLRQLLTKLKPREEQVLRMRFGIDCEEMTLEEIGKLFKVTREVIRQIEAKALRKLKHPSFSKKLVSTSCITSVIMFRDIGYADHLEIIHTIDTTIMDALLST